MTQLSPKQRLHKSLRRETVDRPPCICPGGMMNMIVVEIMNITGITWPAAHSDPQAMAALSSAMFEHGGFENVGVPFCMTVEAEAMGAQINMGSRIHEPHVSSYVLNSVSEWHKLRPITRNSGRAEVTTNAIKLLKKKHDAPIIANVCGPISLATSLVEPTTLYRELYRNEAKSHAFLQFITDNLIAFGKSQIDAGADVLTISDPSGTSEILGMRGFTKYTVPYINRILEGIQSEKPIDTIVHICGKLQSIYPAINDIKTDAISFDSITSVKQMADNMQNKAIMGNISTYMLEKSHPEKLKRIAKYCTAYGADILAPACGIGLKTPLNNIRALVDAVKSMADSC